MAARKKKRSTKTRAASKPPRKAPPKRPAKPRKPPSLAARFAAAQPAIRARVLEIRAAEKAEKARRSKAAKKGAATRRAKHRAALVLSQMLDIAARGNDAKEWRKIRPQWHDAKWELLDAVGSDRERYLDILDDIADEADTDWQIAYGPEPEG